MTEILLVADEPWIVNDVEASLADRRYAIEVLDDPRRVGEHLASRQFDVVLADMQTGTMGAMAVTRAVRAAGPNRPPVIVLLDRDADAFIARRAGAAGWVRKPFSTPELRQAIEGVAAADPS